MSEHTPANSIADHGLYKSLSLSCLGAGHTGSTLCKLLSAHLQINQVINRTHSSAHEAVKFIGAGEAIGIDNQSYTNLKPADIWMLTCPDDQLQAVGDSLLNAGVLQPGNIVFHCSGAISSGIFSQARAVDIGIASLHPVHSFADPKLSLQHFAGTSCAIEGDSSALEVLSGLFKAIGADLFSIDRDKKALYHASTVMACNNLVSLLELSKLMLSQSGVNLEKQHNPLQALIHQTLNNYFDTDAKRALTGPISRGDTNTIETHLTALEKAPEAWRQVYSGLGSIALDISATQGKASTEDLKIIADLLKAATEIVPDIKG
ncbi:MAG: DUF2520 domain-containing protein [Porticoccaceae bacterium]